MPITPIGSQRTLLQTVAPPRAEETASLPARGPGVIDEGGNFGARLTEALEEVNQLQVDANQQLAEVASGRTEVIHEAISAMNKADLALQLTIQITNRAIDAYRQISQMQV